MYIAYSALRDPNPQNEQNNQNQTAANQPQNRNQAYQNICTKYSREIADIQKYLPGWQPKFY
jgi:hypothetical protein